MPSPRDLCRGLKRLLPLVEFALRDGWEITRTPGKGLKFIKPGLSPIYTSSTASDHRADRHACSQLHRAEREAAKPSAPEGRHG